MSADSFLVWTEKWFAHPSPQPLNSTLSSLYSDFAFSIDCALHFPQPLRFRRMSSSVYHGPQRGRQTQRARGLSAYKPSRFLRGSVLHHIVHAMANTHSRTWLRPVRGRVRVHSRLHAPPRLQSTAACAASYDRHEQPLLPAQAGGHALLRPRSLLTRQWGRRT